MNTETLVDELRSVTRAVHLRNDGTIEAVFTFVRRDSPAVDLGWVIDPARRRVRKLLDYGGWTCCRMTVAGILDAIERAERRDTRRCFPGFPEYWAERVKP